MAPIGQLAPLTGELSPGDGPYDYPDLFSNLPAIASEAVRELVSTDEGQDIRMSWIAADRIPREHRAFVKRHTDRAGALLGLGHVDVRWFGPSSGAPGFWGRAPGPDMLPVGVCPDEYPMTIALNAGIRGERVAAVIAHEVRHLAQRALLERLSHPVEREADADRFATAYVEQGDLG
jgi:hypothetical protein